MGWCDGLLSNRIEIPRLDFGQNIDLQLNNFVSDVEKAEFMKLNCFYDS